MFVRVSALITLIFLALLLSLPGETHTRHNPFSPMTALASSSSGASEMPFINPAEPPYLPNDAGSQPTPTAIPDPYLWDNFFDELEYRETTEETRYPTIIARAPVPITIIPDRPREEIITYTVQAGDTVFGIAGMFGISPETIMWSNGDLENHPDDLAIGRELVIIPVSGVYHKVNAGETLQSLAQRFKVEVSAITDYSLNSIGPDGQLSAGQMLIVPGGKKPYVPRTVSQYSGPIPAGASKGTGNFGWPVSGRITQGYWSLHRAIDIGASTGTPVVASDSGYVVYAGWDRSGYGNLIILDHGNGYITYYAHLSAFHCSTGDSVAKGQRIGSVGSTGRSTGSHLHFEIRQGSIQRNPLGFLP